VYSVGAYPFGKLSDRVSHRALLAGGLLALLAADLLLAWRADGPVLWAGIAMWGLHMAITQGLLASMVAEAAPADLRGTAFGFFNLMSGLALLVASGLAGLLWDLQGPAVTFAAGAVLSIAALALLCARPGAR
jgi:MFS family permease